MDDEAAWFKSMNVFMPPKALLNKHSGFESFQEADPKTTDEKNFKVSKWLFFVIVFGFSIFSYPTDPKICAPFFSYVFICDNTRIS
jgi:hypothetical protein